jgi:hypothetical protein
MDDYEERRILSMWKTKRAAMMLALGLLLMLFSTAFAAAPTQASESRTAASPPPRQLLQAGWSGWFEVPGNGFTVSGPATTFYNGSEYVFVRGTNNKIYLNTFNGTTWSGWSEVPGHGLTLSGPTTAVSIAPGGTFLNLFVRGTNNHLYVNRTSDGTTWSGWSEVPGHGLTPSAPAATLLAFNVRNTLYLFVRSTDNKINVNTFANGTTWSGWGEVPGHGSTFDSPAALAIVVGEAGNQGYVDLFVRGTNNRTYVNSLSVTP